MTVRNPKLKFKKSMIWEPSVEEFVKQQISGYTLNVPCGDSLLGNERVDMDAERNPTKIADMNEIPFANNTFDTVISDPPWHINFFHRPRQFFELIRVCKVGGKIIFNATWVPTSKAVELKEVWIRQSTDFSNASMLSVFEKTTDVYDKQDSTAKVKQNNSLDATLF